MSNAPDVILGSTSETRAKLLKNAGVPFTVQKPIVDEEAVKESLLADDSLTPLDIAVALAEFKAVAVSRRAPMSLVIGADQVLEFEGQLWNKAKDLGEAKEQLLRLSGKTHKLISAACVALGGRVIWHYPATVKLTMRSFDEAFVEHYLDQVGDAALWSVGGYQLEGLGAQLFQKVEGDFFTVLGLPLFETLEFLRAHKVVA